MIFYFILLFEIYNWLMLKRITTVAHNESWFMNNLVFDANKSYSIHVYFQDFGSLPPFSVALSLFFPLTIPFQLALCIVKIE